ncbi:MAG: efflux RND transporter periplasmic adaptor subunit, partial [Deltaproteobacteria bacterium]|nr:efflux RND transporter periplasmic adaptor subunit [Deltaproteobacteria bacterium]
MKRTYRKVIFVVVLGLAAAAAWILTSRNRPGDRPPYRFAGADRGNIVRTVSASGTLNAVVTVQLLADYNSPVTERQVIARIDPENLEARVRQAEAELQVAKANVAIQKAAVL